jgi:hypothetical protein
MRTDAEPAEDEEEEEEEADLVDARARARARARVHFVGSESKHRRLRAFVSASWLP